MNAPISLSLTAEDIEAVEQYQREKGFATFEDALHDAVVSFLRGCKDTSPTLSNDDSPSKGAVAVAR